MRRIRLGMVGAAVIAVALIGGLLIAGTASAQGGATISIESGSAATGAQGTVNLDAGSIGDPGLGAWTVDIAYDDSLITAVECTAEQGGVCNEVFESNMARITGASAGGLEGDTSLGSVTFECGSAEGSSPLTLTLNVFADATIGDPQDIEVTIINGTFDCTGEPEEEDPPVIIVDAGTGGLANSSSSFGWLIAMLAVIGTTAVVVVFGLQRTR